MNNSFFFDIIFHEEGINMYNKYGYHKNNEQMLNMVYQKVDCPNEIKVIKNMTTTNYLKQLLDKRYGFNIEKNNKNYTLISKKYLIKFKKISDHIYMEDEVYLKKIKKELLNQRKRNGKCHYYSIYYSEIGNQVVTGYVNDLSRNFRIVHSWIEKNDEVFDFTYNLIMSKDMYYKLLDVQILNVISSQDIEDDDDLFEIYDFSSLKLYCLFRDNIVKEFNKNILILKK